MLGQVEQYFKMSWIDQSLESKAANFSETFLKPLKYTRLSSFYRIVYYYWASYHGKDIFYHW